MIYIDQLNHQIELPAPPKRIISLVPSQTELLYDLGLRDEVIGITIFCIHPDEWYRTKTRVGGTKKIDFEKIKALQPDLIIGNKEENEKSQIEELMKHYPVWMSDIITLKDAYDMITRVGTLVNKQNEAINLKLEIEHDFNSFILQNQDSNKLKPETINNKPRTAYFIWNNPFMVAGHNTFINEILSICSFDNVFDGYESRYPEINENDLKQKKPQLLLLSSEPFPFKEKHVKQFQKICPEAIIKIVDGELFSWYGSRLKNTPAYLNNLLQSLINN